MNRIIIGSILFIFIFTSVAEAKRGSTVGELLQQIESQAKLNKGKSNLPTFKKFQTKPVKKVNLKQVKPPASSQLYYEKGSDEERLVSVTDQGINQLYKLTQRFKTSNKRGELWLRLAEAYVEKARLLEFSAYNKYDKDIAAYEQGKTRRRPKVDLRDSRNYNKKAIQLYEWFLRDFPKDDKIPQALFFLGYNYFQLGDEQKGQLYYKRLTKKHPKSTYVDESNFALGEYYFERDIWKDAEIYYRRVSKDRRSRLYAFAMYKLAWVLFKRGQYKNALKTAEKVIFHGRRSKGRNDKSAKGVSSIRLASEALKDIVVFYAESAPYKAAYEYFVKVGGVNAAPAMYERLGYYYMDRGNRTAARFIFNDIINQNPSAPRAFELKYKIVTMFSSAGNEGIFRNELFEWIEQYGPGSAWQKANNKNADLVKKSELLAEATLRNYTLQLHQSAQNSRAAYSQSMAQKGYRLYFATFEKSDRVDEMRFFYGELLYDMKKYEDAAASYLWVVNKSPKSKYYDNSLLNALLSMERSLPTIPEIKEIVGENTQPIEFDRAIKNFEKTALAYLKRVKTGKNRTEVQYKLGTLYYYYNQFDPALKIFNQIIKESPKTKFAEYSANLILDIYNLKKDYIGLEKAADLLLSYPGLKKTGLASQIRTIKQRSNFKQAEFLEKQKKYDEAGKAYELFTLKNPKSGLVTAARFNAAINYDKAGYTLKALGMYKIVSASKSSKNRSVAKNSLKSLPELYVRVGNYPEAASAYETYAVKYPKEKISTDFLFNAAVIREGMRFYTAALNSYEKYLKRSKKKDRWEVLYYMGRIWEKRRKYQKSISFYKKYLNSPTSNRQGTVEAAFKIATLYKILQRNAQAKEWYQKTIRIHKNFKKLGASVGVRFAADANFQLIRKTYDSLVRLKIPANPQKQGVVVKRKLKLLNQLKSELQLVIRYDDADQIVSSLTLQGQALQHMSSSLYNAPLPKGLDAEQTKIYKAEVDKLASPLKDQAIEAYKVAVTKGMELGGYNNWMKVAQKELNRFDEKVFPDRGEKVFLLKKLDSMGI